MRARQFVKQAAGITIPDAIEAPRERTVSNHGDVMSLTVWQEVFLDGSINEVISNLVGHDGVRAKCLHLSLEPLTGISVATEFAF